MAPRLSVLLGLLFLTLYGGPTGLGLSVAQEEEDDNEELEEEPGEGVAYVEDNAADSDDEDEEKEEEAQEDAEELEDEEEDTETQSKHEMADHINWEACMEVAEAVETEVGLFDSDEGDSKILEKAQKVAARAETITGKKSSKYGDMLHAHLREQLKETKSFGASQVCAHLLTHHDEL